MTAAIELTEPTAQRAPDAAAPARHDSHRAASDTRGAREFLAQLRREVETHPAVNHLFLNRIATGMFSAQDFRIFAENHYPLVCIFTSYLERLQVRAPDSGAKLWLARVLVDEYGEGSEGRDHATLYAKFLAACGGDATVAQRSTVPAPAFEFIETHRALVAKAPFLVGLGAVGPGHEWAIPKMFDAVIPGLRRAGLTEEQIHYFTLHVLQDGDHGAWLEEALMRFAVTDEARAQIRRGTFASLDARGRFWDGVQRAVVHYRQPYAVRQVSARERSTPAALLLLAWDHAAAARAVDARVRALWAARRPTLAALVESTRT